MKGIRKKFDRDLYAEFDGPAKQAIQAHLIAQGHTVTVPPENYSVDLYSEVGPLTMYHEAEVSRMWCLKEYPFDLGSVPERKIRLKSVLKGLPLYFWMLRSDCCRALVFSSVHLRAKFLVEVPNRLVEKGEYFYRIPKQLGKEFNLLTKENQH